MKKLNFFLVLNILTFLFGCTHSSLRNETPPYYEVQFHSNYGGRVNYTIEVNTSIYCPKDINKKQQYGDVCKSASTGNYLFKNVLSADSYIKGEATKFCNGILGEKELKRLQQYDGVEDMNCYTSYGTTNCYGGGPKIKSQILISYPCLKNSQRSAYIRK